MNSLVDQSGRGDNPLVSNEMEHQSHNSGDGPCREGIRNESEEHNETATASWTKNHGQNKTRSEFFLGIMFICAVVLIWVATGFVVQDIESDSVSALFVTYVSTNSFMLLFLLSFFTGGFQRAWNAQAVNRSSDDGSGCCQSHFLPNSTNDNDIISDKLVQPLPLKTIMIGGAKIFPFWFFGNYFYNLGLSMTSVTSSTILSGTSVCFTLFFGAIFKIEQATAVKVFGALLCFAGVFCVGMADSDETMKGSTLSGDLVTLIGAMFYSIYVLLIDKLFPGGDSSADMAICFASIGLTNFAVLSPVLIIAYLTGVLNWSFISWKVMSEVLLNSFFSNVCSDYLFSRAILLTSPTLTSMGLSLTIPLSTILDAVFKGESPALFLVGGGILVTLGFILVAFQVRPSAKKSYEEISTDEREHAA